MSYTNVFNKRIGMKGATQKDRVFATKKRSFERYFENALNKELVLIDEVEQEAVFQDQNQNNNKDLSDDKYIVVPLHSNMKTGSYIQWRDTMWMVFTEENKSIPTHKQGKIKESNHFIKWVDNGSVVGNGKGYPAFIQNQTLYTLGISTSGNHSWIVNAKMMMYLQDNVETRTLKIGQRIFIGGEVYQIMFRDYVSRSGLINFLLEQDFVNENRDDVENEIADYYTSIDDSEDEVTGVPKEVVINGLSNAKIGALVKYEAKVFVNGTEVPEEITDWTIADVDNVVANIVEQTSKHITFRIENNFKRVGSTISVIGKTADGTIGSKAIDIVSPY